MVDRSTMLTKQSAIHLQKVVHKYLQCLNWSFELSLTPNSTYYEVHSIVRIFCMKGYSHFHEIQGRVSQRKS